MNQKYTRDYGKDDQYEGNFINVWHCPYCKNEIIPDVLEAMDKSGEIQWEFIGSTFVPLCPNDLIIYDSILGKVQEKQIKCHRPLTCERR